MPQNTANPGEGQGSFEFEVVLPVPTAEEVEVAHAHREQVVSDQADYIGVNTPEAPDPNTRRQELTQNAGGGIPQAAAGDLPGQEIPPRRRPARVGDLIGEGRGGRITSQGQADAVNRERDTQRLLAEQRGWSRPGGIRAAKAREEIDAIRTNLEQNAPTPPAPGVSMPELEYSEEDRNAALQQVPIVREIKNTKP